MLRMLQVLWIFVLVSGCQFDSPIGGQPLSVNPALEGTWKDAKTGDVVKVSIMSDRYRLRSFSDESNEVFDAMVVVLNGKYFLQLRHLGELLPDGSIDTSTVIKPWAVKSLGISNGDIYVRTVDLDGSLADDFLFSDQSFQAAFSEAMVNDDFYGPPVIYKKTLE